MHDIDDSEQSPDSHHSEALETARRERRRFIKQLAAGGAALLAMPTVLNAMFEVMEPAIAAAATSAPKGVGVSLRINGAVQKLDLDPRTSLLDALREKLDLTGTKKGCDHGQCGACTVIVDGRRVLSCLTLAASCEGSSVTTIEGLAHGEELHPMQASFLKHDGFQCGYCTPGQICSAVALMQEAKNGEASYVSRDVRSVPRDLKLSDDEIRERMSGNICRCGAYPNIVDAIREVHTGKDVAQTWQFAGDGESLFASDESVDGVEVAE
jgi:xanthine dehydrogenase YagT iron-sulfur-binding subunit